MLQHQSAQLTLEWGPCLPHNPHMQPNNKKEDWRPDTTTVSHPSSLIRHFQSSTQQKTLLTQLKAEPGLTWTRAPSRSQLPPGMSVTMTRSQGRAQGLAHHSHRAHNKICFQPGAKCMIQVELHSSVLSRSHRGKPQPAGGRTPQRERKGQPTFWLLGCPRLSRGTIPGNSRISGASPKHNYSRKKLPLTKPSLATGLYLLL